MIIAMIVPAKKFRKVAKKAQITVHFRTGKNCLPNAEELSNREIKFFRPTQSNKVRWSPVRP